MLRDHDIFQSPLNVDLSLSTSVPTPSAWTREIKDKEVTVLPIVSDVEKTYRDGWCVYTYEHTQAPELEIICGGINAKTPKASGIWRQGFLMHFGFEPSPDQMNDNGRALLVNSICYIAKFRQDRPIVRTTSRSYSGVRKYDRGAIRRLIANTSRERKVFLGYYLDRKTAAEVESMGLAEFTIWFEANEGFLRSNDEGKYYVDDEAKQFGIVIDSKEFIKAAISALGDQNRGAVAVELLSRYVPGGPTRNPTREAWQDWYDANREYLFFTDTGGYCWKVDPLAKARSLPTRKIRGPARQTEKVRAATLP